jgi:DNA polymerase III gamma/tau subunit
MLGTASDERMLELFSAVVNHQPGEVISLLDNCFSAGVQPGELLDQCIAYVRDLMVVLSGGTAVALASVADSRRDLLKKHGTQLSMPSVMAAFQILASARSQMFRSTFARTIIEMAMVQLSLLENLSAISDLLSGRLPALPEHTPAAAPGTPPSQPPGTTPATAEKKKPQS